MLVSAALTYNNTWHLHLPSSLAALEGEHGNSLHASLAIAAVDTASATTKHEPLPVLIQTQQDEDSEVASAESRRPTAEEEALNAEFEKNVVIM